MSKTYKKRHYRILEMRDDVHGKFVVQYKDPGILSFRWRTLQNWKGWSDYRYLEDIRFYSLEQAEEYARASADNHYAEWKHNQIPKQKVVKDLGKLP